MKLRKPSFAFLLAILATTSLSAVGCSSTTVEEDETEGALADLDVQTSGWEMDLDKIRQAFGDPEAPIDKPEDLYSVIVDLGGGKKIKANTHLFTKQVNVIPYANPNVEASAAAAVGGRGDAIIANYITPGEVGIMIKHHRGEHRTLKLEGAGPEMKEHFKLQDTHIGLVLGVDRENGPGAISINNPKTYEQGAFGSDHYQMIFVKPRFPQGISADMQALYVDNIRTMSVLFNTVSAFPGDYNGGDPLAARNPVEIQRHVTQMVKAIAGDTAAQQWFNDPANKIYCAELAHVAMSAGVLVPLNEANIVGLLGGDAAARDTWNKFATAVGNTWPFTSVSGANDRLRYVAKYKPDFAKLARLKPISELVQAPARADRVPGKGLAFEPMTMADIVQHFLRTHIPRDPQRQEGTELQGMGERVAPIQGGVLAKMEEGLFEQMKLPAGHEQRNRKIVKADGTPDDDKLMQLPTLVASRQQVAFSAKDVFDGLVKVVSKPYSSYTEFQRELQGWMAVARAVTGPRGDTGEGLFAPPSLFHVVAQGEHPGGFLGLQYLGHGVHFTHVKPAASQSSSTSTAPAPAPSGPAAPPFSSNR